mgnify:FL=1
MFETLVQLRGRGLQLHSRLQAVRRGRAPPDKAVNLFLDVDKWRFHNASSIGRPSGLRKRRWVMLNLKRRAFLSDAVAAGFQPAVEGGILPPGLQRGAGQTASVGWRLSLSRHFPPGWKPGSTSAKMADATHATRQIESSLSPFLEKSKRQSSVILITRQRPAAAWGNPACRPRRGAVRPRPLGSRRLRQRRGRRLRANFS